MRRIGAFFRDRLGLDTIFGFLKSHRVPPDHGTWRGWFYVFGMATLTAFLLQVLTGIALTSTYIPSPAAAYESIQYLTHDTRWGWLVRALHFYGASAMVVLVTAHMSRVFLSGAYKFPREMQWITGVVLLVFTLTMAWTGQLLRWNQDGVWTVMVGARFAERVPFIGDWLAVQVLGGDTIGGATLSRFFVIHAIVLPLLIVATVGVHLWMVLYNGISEWPKAGRKVDPTRYRAWFANLKKTVGIPYWPNVMSKELIASFVVVAIVFLLAVIFGPVPPGLPPDPTHLAVDPRPDWFVTWYYALIWVKPRGLEDLFMVYLPMAALLALLALPLVFKGGERAPSRRPWAIIVWVLAALFFGILTALGLRAPWVPAVETEPLTEQELGEVDPEVLRGAELFVERGCQYCHAVHGQGGQYGPDLTQVATRLSPEEMSVRIVMGIRDMPAYREILPTEELETLVHFLQALEGT